MAKIYPIRKIKRLQSFFKRYFLNKFFLENVSFIEGFQNFVIYFMNFNITTDKIKKKKKKNEIKSINLLQIIICLFEDQINLVKLK